MPKHSPADPHQLKGASPSLELLLAGLPFTQIDDLPPILDLRDPALYRNRAFARIYDTFMTQSWHQACQNLVEKADITSEDVAADLGAGTGFTTVELLARNPRKLYAIDPSQAMLDELKKKINYPNIVVIHGSIDELAASGLEKPNKIISNGVFVIVNNPVEFLRKVYDYLPTGGRYILTVEDWRDANVDGVTFTVILQRLATMVKEKTGLDASAIKTNQATYTRADVEAMIKQAGGRVVAYSSRLMAEPGSSVIKSCQECRDNPDIARIYRQIYLGKRVVHGTQHVFVTTKY